MMNAGEETIRWLYQDHLKVDEAWSVRTPSGFKWWADKHMQIVEIIGEKSLPDGDTEYLISVRTDFLKSVKINDDMLQQINMKLLPFMSMAGVVHDPGNDTLNLCSLVKVYEHIRGWMAPIIGVASVLQIAEAKVFGDYFAKILGAETATSGHPQRGIRKVPDEMGGVSESLIIPLGQKPSRWSQGEFEKACSEVMQRPPSLLATNGGQGITIEFPFGEKESSLCMFKGSHSHAIYGNGLFLIQVFPVSTMSLSEGVTMALSLNKRHLTESPEGYGFGGFHYEKDSIVFMGFLPNALYRPGLLPNLFHSCAKRAKDLSVYLTGHDWTSDSFDPRRSSAFRLSEEMKNLKSR